MKSRSRGVTGSRVAMCIAVLASAVLSGCGESVTGPDIQNQIIVGGITYRMTSFAIAESFPVQIGVTVEVSNTSGTATSVIFPDGCVLLMRAYDAQDNLAWDHGNVVSCTQALVEVDLPQGQSKTYQTGLVSAYTILESDLPDGEYRIAVYLRPGGQEVELVAGLADLAIPRN